MEKEKPDPLFKLDEKSTESVKEGIRQCALIDALTLHMNRVRQAAITKEIIEVVSGAAAAE